MRSTFVICSVKIDLHYNVTDELKALEHPKCYETMNLLSYNESLMTRFRMAYEKW
jgi:hypothetical protein